MVRNLLQKGYAVLGCHCSHSQVGCEFSQEFSHLFLCKVNSFQDDFKQPKLFCMKCVSKAHAFHRLSSGHSVFHWICDHKHLVIGICSCSWAEFRYMVCSGVQMKGRGEEMQDGVICSTFVRGLTSFSGMCVSWR